MKTDPTRLTFAMPLVIAAAVAGCSKSTDPDTSGPVQADVSIVQGAQVLGFQAYDPDTITMHLNGAASVKVTWRNDDQVGGVNVQHTVTDTTAANAFNVTIDPGDTASVVFSSTGSFPYMCSFHMGMRGLVIVQP